MCVCVCVCVCKAIKACMFARAEYQCVVRVLSDASVHACAALQDRQYLTKACSAAAAMRTARWGGCVRPNRLVAWNCQPLRFCRNSFRDRHRTIGASDSVAASCAVCRGCAIHKGLLIKICPYRLARHTCFPSRIVICSDAAPDEIRRTSGHFYRDLMESLARALPTPIW